MTSITADALIQKPAHRPALRTVASFVAGVILASGVAVGISQASDDAKPRIPVVSVHAPDTDPGCVLLGRPC